MYHSNGRRQSVAKPVARMLPMAHLSADPPTLPAHYMIGTCDACKTCVQLGPGGADRSVQCGHNRASGVHGNDLTIL